MLESTRGRVEPRDTLLSILPSLTVEAGIYGALALLALGMRFLWLDKAPLDSREAQQAIAAWHWVNGSADSNTGSPLLFTVNALLFGLFGATDLTPRILTALSGSLLVLVPAILRRELGRVGMVIAALFLSFSPSLIFFSRQADGAILASTFGMAALACSWRYWVGHHTQHLYLSALAAALGLCSSREIWTIVFAAGLVALVAWFGGRRTGSRPATDPVGEDGDGKPRNLRRDFQRAALLFGVTFIAVSTTFLMHREGLGAAFDLFGLWLDGLRPGFSINDPLRLLVIYEPLALFVGSAALFEWFSLRSDSGDSLLGRALVIWVVFAFIIYSIGSDKTPSRLVVVVVPLLLGAAWYLGEWLTAVYGPYRTRRNPISRLINQEVPVFSFGCVLAAFLYLILADFATRGSVLAADLIVNAFRSGQGVADQNLNNLVMVGLVAVVVIVIALLAVSTVGAKRARNVGIALGVTLLFAWQIRQAALTSFSEQLNPNEWLVQSATSENVRDLVSDLQSISRWRANDSRTLSIVADDALGSVVRWYLRDFVNARFQTQPTVEPGTEALLLPPDTPVRSAGLMSQQYRLEQVRGSITAAEFDSLANIPRHG